ncbi:hypothetical protein GCM10023224_26350 [Streptomonospora halophila]|uniref:Uncharacterized protein n=1 Tax=Streptomonospora halophila TaxID=427369 RepID=A0ABP9GGE3_9ACTN
MGADTAGHAARRAARRAGARAAGAAVWTPFPLLAAQGARLCSPVVRGLSAAALALLAASALSSAAAGLRSARALVLARAAPAPQSDPPPARRDGAAPASEETAASGESPARIPVQRPPEPVPPAVPVPPQWTAPPRPPAQRPAPPRTGTAGADPAPPEHPPPDPPEQDAPQRKRGAAARPRWRFAGGAWRPAALWWLRVAVLVQVAAVLAGSVTVGAPSAPPVQAAALLHGPLLGPVLFAGAAQAAAAAAIAAAARTSRLPAVFSLVLLAGTAAQGRLAGVDQVYVLLLGAVLVAPGLWVALWAWGWRWPEPDGAEARVQAPAD